VVLTQRRSKAVSPSSLTVNSSSSPRTGSTPPGGRMLIFDPRRELLDPRLAILLAQRPGRPQNRSGQSCDVFGTWPRTLRILWLRQRCTRHASPKTRVTALRSALEPSMTKQPRPRRV